MKKKIIKNISFSFQTPINMFEQEKKIFEHNKKKTLCMDGGEWKKDNPISTHTYIVN